MKFYSDDPNFFSEVIDHLSKDDGSVQVAHLNFWKRNSGLFKKQWIVVGESLEPSEIVAEVYQNKIPHLLQKNATSFENDLKMGGLLCDRPNEYFQSQFSMIGDSDLITRTVRFSGPDDKARMLEEVFQFLNEINWPTTVESAFAVIEELYMNAVYDAPRESLRQGGGQIQGECEFYLARNKEHLQISCTDPFGALNLDKLFSRMNEVYQRGPSEVIQMESSEGAGIGCFLLFEKCRSLVFGVHKGVQTKVTALLPLVPSRRNYTGFRKSLHGFEVE